MASSFAWREARTNSRGHGAPGRESPVEGMAPRGWASPPSWRERKSWRTTSSALRGAGQDACPDGPHRIDQGLPEYICVYAHEPSPNGEPVAGHRTSYLSKRQGSQTDEANETDTDAPAEPRRAQPAVRPHLSAWRWPGAATRVVPSRSSRERGHRAPCSPSGVRRAWGARDPVRSRLDPRVGAWDRQAPTSGVLQPTIDIATPRATGLSAAGLLRHRRDHLRTGTISAQQSHEPER